MTNNNLSLILLASSPYKLKVLRSNISKLTLSAVFICALDLDEFKRKFAWFPTNLIVVEARLLSDELLFFLQDKGVMQKFFLTKVDIRGLDQLPEKLQAVYTKAKPWILQDEIKRVFKLEDQRNQERMEMI